MIKLFGRLWMLATVLILVLIASVPPARTLLTRPLVISDPAAVGDAAYVLADGGAFRERLDAAADLYLMHRVPLILIMRDSSPGPYSFKANQSWTPTLWALDFLQWRGVPQEDVLLFDLGEHSRWGTLNEAKTLRSVLPDKVARLVLVTSPAHTRRSLLAFRRSLPSRVAVVSYAATSIEQSAEYYAPLWLEYLKLLAYSAVA